MIDIEKFICSLMQFYDLRQYIGEALKDQALEYKKGKIVEVKPQEESAFTVGDWVICEAVPKFTTFKKGDVVQIVTPELFLMFKDCFRLWTIQDAKDGDVLVDKGAIVLFKRIGNEDCNNVIDYYAYTSGVSGEFVAQVGGHYWGDTQDCTLAPATKEQRDTLFKAMHDAGYEWDVEHKQLKKIEPRKEPTEFERGYKQAIEDAVRYMDKVWGLDILGNSINDFRETMEQKLKELSQG